MQSRVQSSCFALTRQLLCPPLVAMLPTSDAWPGLALPLPRMCTKSSQSQVHGPVHSPESRFCMCSSCDHHVVACIVIVCSEVYSLVRAYSIIYGKSLRSYSDLLDFILTRASVVGKLQSRMPDCDKVKRVLYGSLAG